MLLDQATVVEELGRGNFSDARLRRRARRIAESLCTNPALSFPKVLVGAAELEGAYRFFGNPVVTPDRILSGHFDATGERCRGERCALVIHDSTSFSFRADGQRRGLGRLVTSGQTFFAHAALAVSDDGTRRPLGVAGLATWIRDDTTSGNERSRWYDMVETVASRFEGATLIHVMDREADDYVLCAQLTKSQQHFIIRSMHNRLLSPTEGSELRKLDDVVLSIERVVEREGVLAKRTANRSPKQKRIHPPRASRRALLAIGAAPVLLQRPRPHPRDSKEKRQMELPPSIALHVVRVWEPDPPPGELPVEWTLLTTEPIDSLEDIVLTVDRYRARWVIEEYFKALKTGCDFETRQLEDYESLVNALAVFAPIACSLLALRSETRRTPEAPAETVLTRDQLDVLRVLGRVRLPIAPTAQDALLAVAALGGHIKSNGAPGWLILGRGYAELLLLTRGWLAAKLQQPCDQS
jgi:hypothetical protein